MPRRLKSAIELVTELVGSGVDAHNAARKGKIAYAAFAATDLVGTGLNAVGVVDPTGIISRALAGAYEAFKTAVEAKGDLHGKAVECEKLQKERKRCSTSTSLSSDVAEPAGAISTTLTHLRRGRCTRSTRQRSSARVSRHTSLSSEYHGHLDHSRPSSSVVVRWTRQRSARVPRHRTEATRAEPSHHSHATHVVAR
jgi:hypothetical protein